MPAHSSSKHETAGSSHKADTVTEPDSGRGMNAAPGFARWSWVSRDAACGMDLAGCGLWDGSCGMGLAGSLETTQAGTSWHAAKEAAAGTWQA
jgi:hypothetical protein